MDDDFASGASAARNKIASFLRKHGFSVRASRYGCPPTDSDFLQSLLAGMHDAQFRVDSGVAIVIFKWAYSTYHVAVPTSAIQYLTESPERHHTLFSATSPGGGNTFYLAREDRGEIVVHRKKHWSDRVEVIDTTILKLGTPPNRPLQPTSDWWTKIFE